MWIWWRERSEGGGRLAPLRPGPPVGYGESADAIFRKEVTGHHGSRLGILAETNYHSSSDVPRKGGQWEEQQTDCRNYVRRIEIIFMMAVANAKADEIRPSSERDCRVHSWRRVVLRNSLTTSPQRLKQV